MANIGDRGWFGFQVEQNVVARRCEVVSMTPGSVYGPGQPDRYKVLVFVSTDDDGMLDPDREQLAVQPTAGGHPIPQHVVQRECLEVMSPTAGAFWVAT